MESTIKQIGTIHTANGSFTLEIAPDYQSALTGLEGVSHLSLLWWFSDSDTPAARANLSESNPYTHGPKILGVFAARSPERPNPIALSCARLLKLEPEKGRLTLDYIDADDGTPLLDIKPYTPSLDRVEAPSTPEWCAHWPRNVETSGDFDWVSEFCF